MTPKEKAKELVNKYLKASFGAIEEYIPVPLSLAKQCALIAVDEIMEYLTTSEDVMVSNFALDYWKEVKQEIEKL
jgi:hypothetical protein